MILVFFTLVVLVMAIQLMTLDEPRSNRRYNK